MSHADTAAAYFAVFKANFAYFSLLAFLSYVALPAFGGASAARALHICTVASRSQPGLELLQATAAHFGVQVKVLGNAGLMFSYGRQF